VTTPEPPGSAGRQASGSTPRAPWLVIGANGLVGARIGGVLGARGHPWAGTFHQRPGAGLRPLDVTDAARVAGIFQELDPGAVFLAANLAGGVDFCEANAVAATAFHLEATRTIARHCAEHGAALVLLSTDYVFDGTRGPYREDDAKHPLNLYGRLKLAAEEWIQGHVPHHVIARTTNVFGWDPATATPNFLMGLYRAHQERRPTNVPSFLWGNPTFAGDLAEALVELVEAGDTGVFHVVGSSHVNRFDWAKRACDVLGLDAGLLQEVAAPSPTMVPRPLRSWLSAEKFTRDHSTPLRDLDAGLALMKREMIEDVAPGAGPRPSPA
jgi:dTDP-4-dehydrorhamnose reductase